MRTPRAALVHEHEIAIAPDATTADALATGLIKIAYGLARAPESGETKNNFRMQAARSFGIFDPKVAQVLALSGAGTGMVSAEAMTSPGTSSPTR